MRGVFLIGRGTRGMRHDSPSAESQRSAVEEVELPCLLPCKARDPGRSGTAAVGCRAKTAVPLQTTAGAARLLCRTSPEYQINRMPAGCDVGRCQEVEGGTTP